MELTICAVEGDETALSDEEATKLRSHLREIGPEDFIRIYLSDRKVPFRQLGTVFGINPSLEFPKEIYLRILGLAIIRAYHKRQKLTQYNNIDDAATLLRSSQNIMVITGAGISTSLGIPDFRSKGTGFYDKIRNEGYSGGEDVFDIDNFDCDPSVFYRLAGDILPDLQRYTPTHAFLRLLQDKSRLQTNYTQNIDNLEELAGIDRARLIQCHGSFAMASCRKCGHKVKGNVIFDDIRAKRVARCKRCLSTIENQQAPPTKKRKPSKPRKNDWEEESDDSDGVYNIPEAGVMKPDITFFGEQLPDNFFERFTDRDAKTVDLVVVIGTSLKVAPVSEMPNHLPHKVPHIYISREPIEHVNFDIQLLGDCDDVVHELCRRAGWNLQHEMIPLDFKVKVRPVEGSSYRWTVRPRKPKTAPTPQSQERHIDTVPPNRIGRSNPWPGPSREVYASPHQPTKLVSSSGAGRPASASLHPLSAFSAALQHVRSPSPGTLRPERSPQRGERQSDAAPQERQCREGATAPEGNGKPLAVQQRLASRSRPEFQHRKNNSAGSTRAQRSPQCQRTTASEITRTEKSRDELATRNSTAKPLFIPLLPSHESIPDRQDRNRDY